MSTLNKMTYMMATGLSLFADDLYQPRFFVRPPIPNHGKPSGAAAAKRAARKRRNIRARSAK